MVRMCIDSKVIQLSQQVQFVKIWNLVSLMKCKNSSWIIDPFLAHLTQRVMWAIAITWRPSSVVRRKLFQKSSPLKVLDQWKPNLVWIITRVSSFKIVSGDAVHLPTCPLLLKIEHMVKLQVFGNNSKTVNNIKNLTWGKNDHHIKIYLPCNF